MSSFAGAADPEEHERLRILVGVCGAGAVLVLQDYLARLRSRPGWQVRAVLTPAAARILPSATVGLMCDEVFSDGADGFRPGHVGLASWAHRLVVLPATANVLGQAAHGLAVDLLTTVLLAYDGPALFFPSMNERMWRRAPVVRNVEQLRADGHLVVEPVLRSCWELASSSMKVGPALPSPAEVADIVAEPALVTARERKAAQP